MVSQASTIIFYMDTVFEDCDLAELEIKNSIILVISSDRSTPHFLLFISLHVGFFQETCVAVDIGYFCFLLCSQVLVN